MNKITLVAYLLCATTTWLTAQGVAPKAEPCDELNVLTGKLHQHFLDAIKPTLKGEQATVLAAFSEADRDTLMVLRERQAQLDEDFAAFEEKVAALTREGSAKAAFDDKMLAMADGIRQRQIALNAQLNALYLTYQETIEAQMESVLAMIPDWEEQRDALRADYMDVPCVYAHYHPEVAPKTVVEAAKAKQEKQEKALIKNPNDAGKKVTLDDVAIKKIDPDQIGNAKLRKGLAAAEEAPAKPAQEEVVRDEQDLAYRNQGDQIIRIRRTAAFLLWDARTAGYEAPKYFFAW